MPVHNYRIPRLQGHGDQGRRGGRHLGLALPRREVDLVWRRPPPFLRVGAGRRPLAPGLRRHRPSPA
eukprot:9675800-Lingulodinium_polyedra.AAC.1